MIRITTIALFAICTVGCGTGEEHKQLQSANERISDLNKLISERDTEIARLKAERTQDVAQLTERHEAELQALKAFHSKQLADLETKAADLQMELGTSEKQRLALQGLIDQPERIEVIRTTNNSIERVIWFTICLACLGVAGFVGTQYFNLRGKRREDLVRIIAKLGHQL